MKNRRKLRASVLLILAVALLALSGCGPSESLNAVTKQGHKISDLFYLSFILTAIVLAIVFAALIYSMIKFRGNHRPSTRTGNVKLEITWTVIPALLVTFLFIMSVRTMLAVDETHPDAIVIDVTGNQWWWAYNYAGLGFTTAYELHVPVGKPVQLKVTGSDVIHSYWVPKLGWKMDTIPNKINVMNLTATKAGSYDGACAEFCGTQHAGMRMRVVAQPPDQFDAWVKQQQQSAAALPPTSLERNGRATFLTQSCATCHTVNGTEAQGKVGPDLTHFGSRSAIGSGQVTNTPANLEAWIKDPASIKPGVLMPGYDKLSADQMKALIAYLEGLK